MDNKLTFKVEQFDAPLDLILTLLQKSKLNIFDIDISSLLEQYLEQIRLWQQQNLDVASEFLEMASRLVYIKTVSLLPRHEEDAAKLKQELTGQLIEYRLCKLAARRLGDLDSSGDLFVRDPVEFEIDQTYDYNHPAGILFAALSDALGKEARRRPPPRAAFEPLVERPVVSVTAKIFTVLRALRSTGKLSWDKLFAPGPGRSSMVATLLAVLELIKSGKIVVLKKGVALKKDYAARSRAK